MTGGNTGGGLPTTVALIGLGGSAERILLPALASIEKASVVAGCEPLDEVRDRMAARWGIPRTYADAGKMLAVEQPDIAIVATPPLTHTEMCLLAIEYGSHVFCEKPFAPSVEDADAIIAAAHARDRVVAVNNQYYQMPIYREASRIIRSGEAGRLYHIEVWQHMNLLPAEEGGWKAALGPRRVLYEFGTHALDLICQFFDSYPESVSARIPKVRADVNADVFVSLRLNFPGDRVANVLINRVSHAPKRYLEMRLDCENASLRASLGGVARIGVGWNSELSRPRLEFSLTKGGELRWERDGRSRTLVSQPRSVFSEAVAAHFEQFLSAIDVGAEPPVSAAHARKVLGAVLAGYASAANDGALTGLDGVSARRSQKEEHLPIRANTSTC